MFCKLIIYNSSFLYCIIYQFLLKLKTMESNKKDQVSNPKNHGANLQTAANTGINTAEKEKSFDNSGQDSDDLNNSTRKDKPSNLNKGSEFLNDSNTGQNATNLKSQ